MKIAGQEIEAKTAATASEDPVKVAGQAIENKPADETPATVTVSTSGPVTEEKKDAALAGAKLDTDAPSTDANPADEQATKEPASAGEKPPAPVASATADSNPADEQATQGTASAGEKPPAPLEHGKTGAKVAGLKGDAAQETEGKQVQPEQAAKPDEPGESSKAAYATASESAGQKPAAANGPAADVEMNDKPVEAEKAAEALPGEKRTAEAAEVASGHDSNKPAEKKARADENAELETNGGAAAQQTPKGKKDKKPAAPVGKTARRTRSQGLAEA